MHAVRVLDNGIVEMYRWVRKIPLLHHTIETLALVMMVIRQHITSSQGNLTDLVVKS